VRVNQPKENRMSRIQDRLAREEGFTLIELLVVVAIIGILLAIAVPSYLGFKNAANRKAAAADVRAAVPSAEQWYADHNSSYLGMDAAGALATYDSNIDIDHVKVNATNDGYCLDKTVGGKVAKVTRGVGAVNNGTVVDADGTAVCA
jgi:prepilin-type N-terminal cleavage/methylation domain-containing protein